MRSTWDLIQLPDGLKILFVMVMLVLALAPFVPGLTIGGVGVPKLPKKTQRIMRVFGPLSFTIAILAFVPIWSGAIVSDCNFYRNSYGPGGEWQQYDPTIHGRERFWVGCRIKGKRAISIESVRTDLGVAEDFYVGFNPQRLMENVTLSPEQSEWVAVPVELSAYDVAALLFSKNTQIEFRVREATKPLVGDLPSLIFP